MSTLPKLYNTKLTIEVDISTQFGPESAVALINILLDIPAIKSVSVEKLSTDYVPFTEFDTNRNVMETTPFKLISR